MTILAAVALALSLFCAVLAFRPRRPIAARLEMVRAAEGASAPDAFHRVLLPGAAAFSATVRLLIPSNVVRRLARLVEEAGTPMRPGTFLMITLVSGVGLSAWMGMGAVRGGLGPQSALTLALLSGGLGVFGPVVWLRGRAARRRLAVERALPDFLDLVVVSVEAGLGFEGAVARIAERAEGPLAAEFRRVLADQNLGATRRQALQSMQQRCPAPGIGSLVSAILQAERTGMGIGQVLRAQGDRLRVRRRQRAEESAMKAPIKMLFPLVFFIFPSLFVVVLGPAVLSLMRSFGGT
ncbi:MAG: type II secretion system F family protein [Dehalococcoidia bacterium]|nr:MAG: type II secretion system F family protein [Dehalococcoidia bacterium]